MQVNFKDQYYLLYLLQDFPIDLFLIYSVSCFPFPFFWCYPFKTFRASYVASMVLSIFFVVWAADINPASN